MASVPPSNQPAIEPVPRGAVDPEFRDRARSDRSLPLERPIQRWARGWEIRLPVRAEHIMVEKRAVVVERVTVRRSAVEDVVHVDERVRREQMQVETEGDVEATRRLGPAGAADDAPTAGQTLVRARPSGANVAERAGSERRTRGGGTSGTRRATRRSASRADADQAPGEPGAGGPISGEER